MNTLSLICLLLGFFTYWVVKVRAVVQSDIPVNSFGEFLRSYVFEMLLSAIAVSLVALMGNEIPTEWGSVNKPLNAFLLGGSAPSIFNNLIGAFFAKK